MPGIFRSFSRIQLRIVFREEISQESTSRSTRVSVGACHRRVAIRSETIAGCHGGKRVRGTRVKARFEQRRRANVPSICPPRVDSALIHERVAPRADYTANTPSAPVIPLPVLACIRQPRDAGVRPDQIHGHVAISSRFIPRCSRQRRTAPNRSSIWIIYANSTRTRSCSRSGSSISQRETGMIRWSLKIGDGEMNRNKGWYRDRT